MAGSPLDRVARVLSAAAGARNLRHRARAAVDDELAAVRRLAGPEVGRETLEPGVADDVRGARLVGVAGERRLVAGRPEAAGERRARLGLAARADGDHVGRDAEREQP